MMMPLKATRIASIATAVALCCTLAALAGCAAQEEGSGEDANVNGGAEQSFSTDELADHDGSSYFPDAFTFEELLGDHDCQPGQATEGGFSAGGYIVGAEGAPTPGLYHLAGTQTEDGDMSVYVPADEGTFKVGYSLSYFGFALIQLEAGDAIFFMPPTEEGLMSAQSAEPLPVSEPLMSGLYRVGTDIPAGSYAITQEEQSAQAIAAKGFARPQALIYANLTFEDESTLREEDLPPYEEGPVQITITVEDGQYLELYGCTATPLAS